MINPPTRPLSVEEILRIVDWQFLQSKMSPIPLADPALDNPPTIETVPDPNDYLDQENVIPTAAKKNSYKKWVIAGAIVTAIGLAIWAVCAYNKQRREKEKMSK